MTLIKICGITRPEDAVLAAELGADFIGLIFVKESPRSVTPEQAREIAETVTAQEIALPVGTPASPPAGPAASRRRASLAGETPTGQPAGRRRSSGPATVGVFRNMPAPEINAIARIAGLDLIQLHGDEPDSIVRELELPVIRAVRVTDTLPNTRTSAPWLLFDTGGGSGRTFDWSLLWSYERTTPFFLAGGLTPDNVAEAIRIARPDAIDLSSGVESAPGIKDHDKMKSLFARVRR